MAEGKWGIYYHYTSKEGLDGILIKGKIKPSIDTSKDAVLGKGVYVTTLNPKEHSKRRIAENNYDSAWKRYEDQGKVDYYIKMNLKNKNVQMNLEGRDIGRHKKPIKLGKIDFEYGSV